MTVLVVDNSPHERYVTTRVLERAGFDVREAASARHAEQVAVAANPHVIILDLPLPDIAGIDVCRSLKSNPVIASIPMILKTDYYTAKEHQREALRAGAAAYLLDPVAEDVLVSTVRGLLPEG